MSIKKALAVASGLLASSLVFAEGTLTVDTTQASAAVTAIGTAISGLITGTITQQILLIIGAGLAIAAIFLGVRWLMKGGKVAAR